jgi:tetratricopeptide (TPR) repeat protein
MSTAPRAARACWPALLATTLAAALALAPPAWGAPADAPGNDVDIAKAHFGTGQAYYEHGRFADAAREFEEAYRIAPRAPLLYNVGKSYEGANDLARALDAYRRFLEAAPADSADRPEVTKRVAILATLVGSVTLHGAVDGSAITVDGVAAGTTPLQGALVINPGRRTLVLSHERYVTFKKALDVPVGGTLTVEVEQPEAVKLVPVASGHGDTPVYKKWWLWTAVGGAVVAAGVITAVVLTQSPSAPGGPTIQLPTVQ